MKTNPPAAADAPRSQICENRPGPRQNYDASKLKADFIKRIPQIGFDRIMVQFKINPAMQNINGWGYTTKTGIYGTDYLMRALVTAIGLGANRPQDAVYPTSLKDANGDAYDGGATNTSFFRKDQTPPVEGFWSITMYDDQYFFVANPINRYSISPRQNLKAQCGRLDRSLRPEESPGADKETNWLPAPAGKFILMLRMYWPNETDPSILDGSWTMPPVTKVTKVG